MVDNNTKDMQISYKRFNKPHIYYLGWSEGWLCYSEDGPWGICIGSGETPLSAYHNWMWKAIGFDITIDKHWNEPCQDGDE